MSDSSAGEGDLYESDGRREDDTTSMSAVALMCIVFFSSLLWVQLFAFAVVGLLDVNFFYYNFINLICIVGWMLCFPRAASIAFLLTTVILSFLAFVVAGLSLYTYARLVWNCVWFNMCVSPVTSDNVWFYVPFYLGAQAIIMFLDLFGAFFATLLFISRQSNQLPSSFVTQQTIKKYM